MSPETRIRFPQRFPFRKRSAYPGTALAAAMIAVTLGFAALGAASLVAEGKKPEEFKAAIKAQDQGDWKKSAELIRIALQRQPEDGERVRIYGTRYLSYLPHYYLGLALYKQGDCAGALKEWEQCSSTGAVQTSDVHEALRAYRLECQNRMP